MNDTDNNMTLGEYAKKLTPVNRMLLYMLGSVYYQMLKENEWHEDDDLGIVDWNNNRVDGRTLRGAIIQANKQYQIELEDLKKTAK